MENIIFAVKSMVNEICDFEQKNKVGGGASDHKVAFVMRLCFAEPFD